MTLRECPDWTRNAALIDVARDAWKHIPQTSIEHHVNVQCTLAFVQARGPQTFDVAAQMVREIAHIRGAMVQRVHPYGDDTTSGRNAGLVNGSSFPDETRESASGRDAIAQHALAEAQWHASRGRPVPCHAELEAIARRALVRAEMKRVRG